jgi:RHS repeat-associated protein
MMIENKKHYCAENQRIASKMGSGCESKDCINRNDTNDRNDTKFHTMLSALQSVTIPAEDSLQVVFSGDKIDHLKGSGGREDLVYYYTGNHLSSTQLVTDGTAVAVQQVEYAPFGEVVNEYNIDWSNGQVPDFKFNGKELDEENGMYYFEARYQSPPVFISRDPHYEKYPTFSPYTFCFNNPVNVIDPTGKDGRITYTETEAGATVVIESTIHVYGKNAEEAATNANAYFSTLNNKSSVEVDGKRYDVELKLTWQACTELDINTNIENMSDDDLKKLQNYTPGDNFMRVGVPMGGGENVFLGLTQRGGTDGFSYATSGGPVVHESLHTLGFGDTDLKNDIMNNRFIGHEINQKHFIGMVNMTRHEIDYKKQLLSENPGFSKYVGQDQNNPKKFQFKYRNQISY